MLNIPILIAQSFAKSAQVRANVLLQKALIGAIAAAMLCAGSVFLLVALYIVGSRLMGPAAAATVLGLLFVAIGVGILVYHRRKLSRATPSGLNPVEAASVAAEDPSVAADGSIVPPPHKILSEPTTLEGSIEKAMAGDYSQITKLAVKAGRELGSPTVAFSAAGLIAGYVISRKFRKDD